MVTALPSPLAAIGNAPRAACLAAAVVAAGSAPAQRMVVLTSADTAPYQQAIAGAQSLNLPMASPALNRTIAGRGEGRAFAEADA